MTAALLAPDFAATPESPFATALFIVLAMGLAGVAHVLWLRTPLARSLSACVDFGHELRGRRIFGDHKKVRGFLVMPPASALSFAVLGAARDALPAWLEAGIWRVPPSELGALGLFAGLAFMFAELPNSFVKRQIGVAPGASPSGPALGAIFFLVDRFDSVLGTLIALSLCIPVSAVTWVWVLLLGPCVHAAFSVALYVSGVKARAL